MSRFIAALLLLFGQTVYAQNALIAQFDPSNGILPTPNNLLFNGSQDGTLNIPISDPDDPSSAVIQTLNRLDGFSTVAPAVATFSAAVDPASLMAGKTVRMFEVDLINPFLNPVALTPFEVTEIRTELVGGQDFTVRLLAADTNQRTIEIVPLKPLKPKTGYMIVLTNGIQGADKTLPTISDLTYIFAGYNGHGGLLDEQGRSRFSRLTDAQAQTLEPIRRIIVSQEHAAASVGLRRAEIVLSWSFMTQSIDDALQAIQTELNSQMINLIPTGLNTSATLGLGLADILAGTLQVPYYLEAPSLVREIILSTRWQGSNGSDITRYNPVPVATQSLSIPVLVTVPNASSGQQRPATGWPIVIFQHGITQNRTNLLFIADALATAGLAAIAIDLPLHGITDNSNPFYNAPMERTFNVDLINNETGAPGPDGNIDPSGAHFINIPSLITSRDNLRQGAADLLHLAASLNQIDADNNSEPDFDNSQMGFIGHSLGGMVGTVFLGTDQSLVNAASLGMIGGGIPKLLENSASFGPRILAGLAAIGLEQGTEPYEAFFRSAQHILDPGDPINYAASAADHHPVHAIEIIGPPPDQTIPNSASDAPLAGTEPLLQAMELTSVGTTVSDPDGLRVAVRFLAGEHGSLINPAPDPAVTLEIQQEIAAFMTSQGTFLPITNTAIVQQP